MKSFSLKGKDYLIVDVSEGATEFCIENELVFYWIGAYWEPCNIPEGNYKTIGLTNNLTEEQYGELVAGKFINGYTAYKNYGKAGKGWFYLPKESFESFMQSQGLEHGLLIEKIG